jgi:hypothetical protein
MIAPVRAFATPAPGADIPSRAIPFDHSFQFKLEGREDVLRQTVTVSVEASFTAVSIGYGVVPFVTPITFAPQPAQPLALALQARVTRLAGRGNFPMPLTPLITTGLSPAISSVLNTAQPVALRDVTLGDMMSTLERALATSPDVPKDVPPLEAALRIGVRLNPQFASTALLQNGNSLLDPAVLQRLFQVSGTPAEEVRFLYALFDDATGREFQSDPILNTAGLGAADGGRPFRYFAHPITFGPRAAIRLEITPRSDFKGDLHVTLHGYKVLTAGGAAPPRDRPPRRQRR